MKTLFLLFSLSLYANYAPKSSVENCINLSSGKLTPPPEAAMVVSARCAEGPCEAIPAGFSCITFSYQDKVESQEVLCSVIELDQNPTPTEPVVCSVNPCDPNLCPSGYPTCSYTPAATSFSCSRTVVVLAEDPAKLSAYNAQKANVEVVQTQYQESQLYYNLQNFCLYSYQIPCASLPPATQSSAANSLSFTLGKTPEQIKTLMNKKVNK